MGFLKEIHKTNWIFHPIFQLSLLENKKPTNSLKADYAYNKNIRRFRNPILRVFIVLIMVISSTSLLFNWQMMYNMMLDDGLFIEECPLDQRPEMNPITKRYIIGDTYTPCIQQNDKLKRIYGYYNTAEFIFGVFAGYFFDILGPLITGLIGTFLYSAAFILIRISVNNLKLLYMAAILLGGSCNFIVFSVLCFADYFPNWENFVIASIIAIQNGGTIVPIIMRLIYMRITSLTFASIMWYYYIFYLLPLSVVYLLCLPLIRYNLNPLYVKEKHINDSDNLSIEFRNEKISDTDLKEEEITPLQSLDAENKIPEHGRKPNTFVQDLLTKQYLLYLLLIAIFIYQFSVYGLYMTAVAPREIIDYLGYITPATTILGLIFSFVLNYTKSLPIAICISFLNFFIFIFIQFRINIMQYFAATLYLIGTSVVYSIKFTYVEEMFSSVNQGKLLSCSSLVSGLVALLSTEMIFHDLNLYFSALSAASLITLSLATYLYYNNRGIYVKEN